MNARYYRQRELKKVSTPPSQADMDRYYAMLDGKTCYLSTPDHDHRVINRCHECKFKHRCLG